MTGPRPTGFELSDEDWGTFTEAVSLKVNEMAADGTAGDGDPMNAALQQWWGLLTDMSNARRYIDSQNLVRLKEVRDRLDTDRPAMDAEITRLERAAPPAPTPTREP